MEMARRADVVAKSGGGFVGMHGMGGSRKDGQRRRDTACGWFCWRIARRWVRGGTAFNALDGIYKALKRIYDLMDGSVIKNGIEIGCMSDAGPSCSKYSIAHYSSRKGRI